MSMRFDDKVALVTGASSGMGAATAALLAKRGARVFTAQRRSAGFEDIEADLSDPETPGKVIRFVEAMSGGLDILVNNAGMMREGTVEETSLDDWHDQIHLNLTVPFLFTRHAMPLLKRGGGSIVNVGSIEGLGNNPRHPAYGASKAAVVNLTRYLATLWAPHGVRVNALSPGGVLGGQDEEFKRKFCRRVPMGRMATAEDLRGPLLFLASQASAYVTGTELVVDGGFTAW